MNYKETLDYLYTTLPMFSSMGSAAFKKDLTNIRLLCEKLGNPEQAFKSIHIAGTNGKGSVSHMLAGIFQTGGYKTGLYTSPHLYDFRERIRIDGCMADETYVIDFVQRTKSFIEEIEPSFFEITVAMAFDYFARNEVDIAIIEVGLGGRLDSTNIVLPELSVITNIGWDHMNMLGNTLQQIAFEKGGIIKQKIPVVIGERNKETDQVFEELANQKKAPVYFAGDRFKAASYKWLKNQLIIEVSDAQDEFTDTYTLDLAGIYQLKNILTVLQAIACLKEWQINSGVVRDALKNIKLQTGLTGRWDVIHERPAVVLEVAHNKEGVEQMLQHIQKMNYHQLHLIFGTVKDKDAAMVLKLLPTSALYYFTEAHIPRALDADVLTQQAAELGLAGTAFKDVNTALDMALNRASKDDLIVVCGSIFLVAEVQLPLPA